MTSQTTDVSNSGAQSSHSANAKRSINKLELLDMHNAPRCDQKTSSDVTTTRNRPEAVELLTFKIARQLHFPKRHSTDMQRI
mmetsp:Transcript_2925/g.8561  ORF Transcript_2925/g.8561 Transcript_2925/m.8561 type:complete len:82 (+) Transcript_2925:273-518(+)